MKYYKIIDDKQVFFTGNVLYTEDATIINPSQKQMEAAGWSVYEAPEPTEEELVQQAKSAKIRELMDYDSSSNVNEFSINSTPMWLSHDVRQQLKTSIDAHAALGIEQVTKIFDGREYTFTTAQWNQMLAALEVYASDALNTTERHKVAINNLTSVEDIENYDFTLNYPTKLEF